MASIFITDNSQSLGFGLTQCCLQHGEQVFGVRHSPCPISHSNLSQNQIDPSHQVDRDLYPSINNLCNAMQTDTMPGIDNAAIKVASALPQCLEYPSGSFIDIRRLN